MKQKWFLLMFSFINLIGSKGFGQASDPVLAGKDIAIVETESGKVKGYIHKGIFTYKGIPYAKAERFMAPVKAQVWTQTRSCLTYGPVCPMDPTTSVNDEVEFAFHHNWGYTNENCLSLNVWTPGINDNKKRPVMVWFHGGGFSAGSYVELPSYDGENISRKGDVVLVSVNHRLNVLGFLDLSGFGEKYKSSPNVGLLDLVASLQWVKANIARFGGDPDNITIFGQSGGGGKVTALMNAPSAKGLFAKTIIESGSYLSSFTEQSISRRVATAILEELQLQPSQVDSLQKISYERLNAASKKALVKVTASLKSEGKPIPGFGLGWGPILDSSFLLYQPSESAALELSKNIPLLVGSTKNEFAAFGSGGKDLTMDNVKETLKKKYADKADSYMSALLKAYPETTRPSDYLDVDFLFRNGVINQANLKSIPDAAPIYMYLFVWQSPVNDGRYKAMHCMELPFVFDNIGLCEEMTGGGKEAYALADKISTAWINFARTGNPNTRKLPNWPAYTPQLGAIMLFDNKSEVKNYPDKDLMAIGAGK